MKKPLLFVIAFCWLAAAHGQQSKTLTIEKLETKDGNLYSKPYEEILKRLIVIEANDDERQSETKPGFPYNIIAHNKIDAGLVDFGYHPFFNGMYEAYANHHPFTLSPDMIWLLIAQGFARHVAANSENLRSMFVNFKGKEALVVQNDSIRLDDPNSPWQDIFPAFAKKIGESTGQDLIDTLTPDFTTTTPVDKIAAQVTIMEAMKDYFEYILITMVCGIPKVTIEGTSEDWQKILVKAKALRKYKLDWWIDEIEPLLQQFVRASKDDFDTTFWRNMFKYHTLEDYGKPKVIDGWIIKFFPYDRDGKRNDLKELRGTANLPNEIVKVDVKYLEVDETGHKKITPLELWAGFVGIRQNTQTFALRPETGWMIRKKDTAHLAIKQAIGMIDGIELRVNKIPGEILQLQRIEMLTIQFIGKIIIPDEMAKIDIETMEIFGEITPEETARICRMFPKTSLTINGVRCH